MYYKVDPILIDMFQFRHSEASSERLLIFQTVNNPGHDIFRLQALPQQQI